MKNNNTKLAQNQAKRRFAHDAVGTFALRRSLFIFTLAILFFGSLSIISAIESNVCCEQTKAGAFCQNVEASKCSTSNGLRAIETSCEQSSFCQLGTCVNTNTGECTPNVGKSTCETGPIPGIWHIEKKGELPQCAGGCCKIGNGVAFVSQTECKQLATDNGVAINFLSNINDEPSCLALSKSKERGACVSENIGSRSCTVDTKESCLSTQGKFYADLLCTAPELATDCAKSDNQVCFNDDVYFLDTCGNRANIYDSSKEKDTDYWTDIKDEASCKLGEVGCGDCDYNEGSTCSEDKGDYFCKSLHCQYALIEGEKKLNYSHGESWCAESEGVYPHIEVNPVTMEYSDSETFENLKAGFNQFNLPGSRYYKLNCWEGEVIVEPCRDFRNEICKEANIAPEGEDGFTIAQCRANGWRTCSTMDTKKACEDVFMDCKWASGYRIDRKILPEADRENQGSCLPLYAPGFDFWNPKSSGASICTTGTVSESVKYETHWLTKRSKMEYILEHAANNCIENCYALPGYGNDVSVDYMEGLHRGEKDLKSGLISDRKGYYCHKKGNVNQSKVGTADSMWSDKITCAKKEDKRKIPIFYNNQQWLDFVVERGKSLGDCGFKNNAVGYESQNSTEVITLLFQELSQKGKVKSNSTIKEVYSRNKWNASEDERIESEFVKNPTFFQ